MHGRYANPAFLGFILAAAPAFARVLLASFPPGRQDKAGGIGVGRRGLRLGPQEDRPDYGDDIESDSNALVGPRSSGRERIGAI